MTPDFLFVLIVTCAYHCERGNDQHDPTPNAFASAIFRTENACNKSVPYFYNLMAQSMQMVYPNGKPAENIEAAEKRTYADYRITCSKVAKDHLTD